MGWRGVSSHDTGGGPSRLGRGECIASMSIPVSPVRRSGKGPRGARPLSRQEAAMTAPNVIHFEIVGKDQQALQRYWSDLFGWKLDTNNPGGYGMTNHEDTGIVVGIGGTPDGSAGHVTGYVKVADIDATLARASELGGIRDHAQVQPGRERATGARRRFGRPRGRPDRIARLGQGPSTSGSPMRVRAARFVREDRSGRGWSGPSRGAPRSGRVVGGTPPVDHAFVRGANWATARRVRAVAAEQPQSAAPDPRDQPLALELPQHPDRSSPGRPDEALQLRSRRGRRAPRRTAPGRRKMTRIPRRGILEQVIDASGHRLHEPREPSAASRAIRSLAREAATSGPFARGWTLHPAMATNRPAKSSG